MMAQSKRSMAMTEGLDRMKEDADMDDSDSWDHPTVSLVSVAAESPVRD